MGPMLRRIKIFVHKSGTQQDVNGRENP